MYGTCVYACMSRLVPQTANRHILSFIEFRNEDNNEKMSKTLNNFKIKSIVFSFFRFIFNLNMLFFSSSFSKRTALSNTYSTTQKKLNSIYLTWLNYYVKSKWFFSNTVNVFNLFVIPFYRNINALCFVFLAIKN